MSRSVLLLGICVVLGWGCSDKSSKPNTSGAALTTQPALPPPVAPVAHQVSPPAPPVPTGTSAPAASAAPATAQPAAARATTEDYLEALNEAVGTFGREQKRYPNSLQELMENKYIRALPPAPAGKKFHYDAQKKQIVLISS